MYPSACGWLGSVHVVYEKNLMCCFFPRKLIVSSKMCCYCGKNSKKKIRPAFMALFWGRHSDFSTLDMFSRGRGGRGKPTEKLSLGLKTMQPMKVYLKWGSQLFDNLTKSQSFSLNWHLWAQVKCHNYKLRFFDNIYQRVHSIWQNLYVLSKLVFINIILESKIE